MPKLTKYIMRNWPAFAVAAACVVLGVSLIIQSHAATTAIALEAEDGNRSANASAADAPGASGGKAVKFQGASTPNPTPTPPASGTMDPPAGAKLERDLSRASGWDKENNGYLDELQEKGPGGEPVLRSTLPDGMTGASSGTPSERNDLQGGTVPNGSTRWMIWYERFVQLPDTSLDRWQILGPNEIHGQTIEQAPVQPEVSPDKHRRLNANAGRNSTRYFDITAIKLGQWYQVKFGIHYTQGNDGWIEWWEDGQRVVRVDGPTTTEGNNGYWKFGNYRNASINGTTIYDISGCRVYSQ
jgi:hypothetical protein